MSSVIACRAKRALALAVAVPLLSACGGAFGAMKGGADLLNSQVPVPGSSGSPNGNIGLGIGPSKIKHIIFLIQENRSFDYIFGNVDNNGNPFPGADTVSNPLPGEPTPHNHLGQPVTMTTGLLEECYVPAHSSPNAVTDIAKGKMNGFDKESVQKLACAPAGKVPADYAYRYAEYSEVQPYWQIGEQYAISDRMFEASTSASFAAHLYYVAGQSSRAIDNPSNSPWGCDAPAGTEEPTYNEKTGGEAGRVFPCFEMPTLADEMDLRQVSWRYYGMSIADFGYNWIAYDAIRQIRFGADWSTNVVNPSSQILTDIQNGSLASMTWVTPSLANSDHPLSASNLGPSWIASVVNAVGQSQFWNDTAIFVVWDDWGGWYDHAPPGKFGPVGYGIRLPFIAVSPYVRNGYVSHVVHSPGSMLRFAEEILNLPSLGEIDAKSDDLADLFNFTQTPTPFTPFALNRSPADVVRGATDPRPLPKGATPDD
jgi:phospholipase C